MHIVKSTSYKPHKLKCGIVINILTLRSHYLFTCRVILFLKNTTKPFYVLNLMLFAGSTLTGIIIGVVLALVVAVVILLVIFVLRR